MRKGTRPTWGTALHPMADRRPNTDTRDIPAEKTPEMASHGLDRTQSFIIQDRIENMMSRVKGAANLGVMSAEASLNCSASELVSQW